MKAIVLTRRLTIGIIAISVCATLVLAGVLSTYLLPAHVSITSQPGISVFLADTSTNTCTNNPITSFDFGDVQQTQEKRGPTVCIRNTGGVANGYIIQAFTTSGQVISSLSTQSPLPGGVTLTWNAGAVLPACGIGGTGGSSLNGNCVLI